VVHQQPSSLSQGVYERLRHQLRAGAFPPGTRLVNRKVAAELGTSTIPVREAIGRLVSEGLLQATPGAGAFVSTPDPNELGELYDVREVLEALAAAEAARLATPGLISELEGICDRFRAIATSIPNGRGKHADRARFEQWLRCEEQFHARLIAAARNRWLSKVVAELRLISEVFAAHRATPRLLTRALADAAAAQHAALVKILARHDAEQARSWMARHIRGGRDELLRHMASQGLEHSSI
jgi:DNA-binding GntR family transcriptional regulator